MKRMNYFRFATVCVAFSLLVVGCNAPADEKETKPAEITELLPVKPDFAKIKADIQALETAWANADNARDTNTIADFYADDAVSMPNDKPMIVGKAEIRKDIVSGLAKRAKGATVAYDVLDVFGDENTVTEVGKITSKDAAGKITYTGKYMAVWEKRDGKYLCVRDISNGDEKAK